MFGDERDDGRQYKVLVNHQGQYSLWPTGRHLPKGWKDTGRSGTKQDCLNYVEEVWTDMRPQSLKLAMDDGAFAEEPSG